MRKGKKVGTGGTTMRNSEVRPEGMAIMYATGTLSFSHFSNFNTALRESLRVIARFLSQSNF